MIKLESFDKFLDEQNNIKTLSLYIQKELGGNITFQNYEHDSIKIIWEIYDSKAKDMFRFEYIIPLETLIEVRNLQDLGQRIINEIKRINPHIGLEKEIIISLLSVLPDSEHENDKSWDWCWESLSGEAQEEVKKVREMAIKYL